MSAGVGQIDPHKSTGKVEGISQRPADRKTASFFEPLSFHNEGTDSELKYLPSLQLFRNSPGESQQSRNAICPPDTGDFYYCRVDGVEKSSGC